MRQLVLHAGLPKTGSSALQVAFARHSGVLESLGVAYPDLGSGQAARDGGITSGNGAPVAGFLNGNDRQADAVDACLAAMAAAPQATTLLSSELFYSARPDRLAAFVERVRAEGFGVRVAFFVRSLYEWAWSAYVQNVKNHGVSAGFPDWVVTSRIAQAMPTTFDKYRQVVPDADMTLVNYDAYRDDVFAAFATHVLGADGPLPATGPVGRINRSLTATEIEALRQLNLVRRGRPGGQLLSEALITARPDLPVPPPPPSPAALELLDAHYEAVRAATARAIGGPVALRLEGPPATDPADTPEAVDRTLLLLLYSNALDTAAALNVLRRKLEAPGNVGGAS